MTLAQLYRNSLRDSGYIDLLLDQTYRGEIERHANRLLKDVPEGIVDNALQRMQERLDDVQPDCDLWFLAFDCLRKEIVRSLIETGGRSPAATNPLLKEYVPDDGNPQKTENRRKCLDIVLALMSGKQRKYFFDRYYFLKTDTTVSKRMEREIACLFAGKGVAVHRFRRYGVKAEPVTPVLYLDCLNDLDPIYLLGIEKPYSDAYFPRASDISTPVVIAEWRISQFRYFLYTIPLLIVLAVVFSIWVLLRS